MEPIPETKAAVEEFGPFAYDGDLLEELRRQAALVQAVVPDCIGLSLASLTEGVTFTLVASAERVATLDAIQYLSTGPCLEALGAGHPLAYSEADLLDEERWRLFARGTAAAAVASTLTLPILSDGDVTGTVNLYGASPNAFTGHHEVLASIFDAWAPGAVTNADMAFETRRAAQGAPRQLRDNYRIEVAAGIVAESEGTSIEEARAALHRAAEQAGVAVVQLADTVIELSRRQDIE